VGDCNSGEPSFPIQHSGHSNNLPSFNIKVIKLIDDISTKVTFIMLLQPSRANVLNISDDDPYVH